MLHFLSLRENIIIIDCVPVYFIIANLQSCQKLVRNKLFTSYCLALVCSMRVNGQYILALSSTSVVSEVDRCVMHFICAWATVGLLRVAIVTNEPARLLTIAASLIVPRLARSDECCLLWVINQSKLSLPIKHAGLARDGAFAKWALTSMFVFPPGVICQIGQAFPYGTRVTYALLKSIVGPMVVIKVFVFVCRYLASTHSVMWRSIV